ncbi:hypothetical protein DSCA_27660 [Desulfosarcina alkanivorans]|uniref:Lipopolysaccharide assembly protein A domain-containing protein n=1 Tax=Desulfosarcina alkanivorans TaxID=571177 RepID=A0A5K7YI73_9BACT|nr:hypothetical protein [Desulfosarcina alkanivorans]BBO68836.1 hypothetical protein DSCA_27660 [Desulfosarcina alkanivorans]
MKTRMIIYTAVVFAMGLIFYQNREFYLSEQHLSLNLLFTESGRVSIANATQVLFFFLAGIVLASVSFYHDRLKMRREINNLKTAFQSCAAQVTEMKPAECPQPWSKRIKLPATLGGRKKTAEKDESPVDDGLGLIPG